jgi:hypothetical protein
MTKIAAVFDPLRAMRSGQFIKETTPVMPAGSALPVAMLGQNVSARPPFEYA